MGCLGSGTNTEVKLKFAYRIRKTVNTRGRNQDRDILIGFSNWTDKSLVLDGLWDAPKLIVEGQELSFYSDLCPLTLKREEKFFASKLVAAEVAYVEFSLQIVGKV